MPADGDSRRARASWSPIGRGRDETGRFLAEPLGSRARAQSLIDAGRVRVDGRVRPKRYSVRAGRADRVGAGHHARAGRRSSRRDVPFTVAYEDEHLLVVDKPAGVVVHPARGHRTGTLAQALTGPRGRRRGAVARRNRASARPRHLGSAGRRQERRGASRAEGAARRARLAARVPGAGRRPAGGPDRDDRRADRPRPARPRADVDRLRGAAEARTHFEIEQMLAARRRCCGSCSRPGAPTRSGSTWRRSGIRCAAIAPYGATDALRTRAPVPARRAARVRASGDRRGDRRDAPRCPRISLAALDLAPRSSAE